MELEFGGLSQIAEVKAAGDAWEVSGYPSTYGNIDQGGDVVMRGAFDAYLASDAKTRFLFAHDSRMVLGSVKELKSDDKGLFGRFSISKTQLGADTHTLLKDGALDSFSIGYVTVDAEFDDVGTRLLKQVDLLEVSIVPIPMNDRAVVTGVKAADISLDDHAARMLGDVESFLVRVKELASLRADDGRKLGAKHFERLETLRVSVAELIALKDAGELTSGPAINVRLELARQRLRRMGLLEHAS